MSIENELELMMGRVRHALLNRPRSVTYEDITKATGLNKSWLSLVAHGKIKSPSFSAVMRLCKFLGVKVYTEV